MKKLTRRKKLIKSHQKLFTKGVGIECGDGWLELIDIVCHFFENKLRGKEIEKIYFAQIKEKFGLLRIYFDVQFSTKILNRGNNDLYNELHNTINTIEDISGIVCEECGRMKNDGLDVSMRKNQGWYATRCDDCYNREKESK